MDGVLRTKTVHWLGAAAVYLAAALLQSCEPQAAWRTRPSETVPSDAAAADAEWVRIYGGMSDTERMKGVVYEPVRR